MMSILKKLHRCLAMVLAAAMLLSLMPVGVLAAQEGTVAGSEVTTQVGANELTERNNKFNKGWKFYLGTSDTAQNQNFNDSAWEDVDLPHDFSIFQDFTTKGEQESGYLLGGTGWYRKTFTVAESLQGKTFLLNFDGVYSDAKVYVNGNYVGEHHYGYTNFAFDITKELVFGTTNDNVISVEVVNNIPTSRWYSGSGIYRDVTMMVMDPVHVNLDGTKITTPDIESGTGTVNAQVEIVNDGASAAEVTVTNKIYEKGSSTAVATKSAEQTVQAKSTAAVTADLEVPSPKLWSIEAPNLYTMVTELSVDGEVVDTYETEFGFRWFEFKADGFHLNGEAVKLNGVCMHHDQGALGSAAYYDAIYRQMSVMKDMGCNAIRVTHNPAAAHLIAVCNELGLLVIEEVFDGLLDPKNENWNDFSKYFEKTLGADNGLYYGDAQMSNAEFVTRSIIRRDRNAPSIIAWSMGNEIQEGTGWGNTGRFDDVARNFISWANAIDGNRPVTSGCNNRGTSQALVDVINVITESGGIAGFNYANAISGGGDRDLSQLLTRFSGKTGAILASETASATNSRGRYMSQNSNTGIDGKMHLTSYDTSSVGWGITAHDSIYNTYALDGVAGEFVWTGFDYIGEPTPWNGTKAGDGSGNPVPNSSYFGIVETTGFEKDTYYLYRSQWNQDETTLHLVTAWDSDNMMTSGGKTPVWIYSNAPVVKLYRNGTHIGTATRVENAGTALHPLYTYTTVSENTAVCTAQATSGADSLYSIFNVAYEAGTISARAFKADGTEIELTGNSGRNSVSTPDAPAKLVISQNKTTVDADNESLVYITVDVTDAMGNLDTMADNKITFSLTGPGKIMGVDNGDQATTKKYQQKSVLFSDTSAEINAYAGKALVIVKTSDDAGDISVAVASEGLTGGTVEIEAISTGEIAEGLVSYTMVKDYSIMEGTEPELPTEVTGKMADGSTVEGTVAWDEISSDVYGTAGDYVIRGTVTFEDDEIEPFVVRARLHVIADVVAMQNISTSTLAGVMPTLPGNVKGILADGTVTGEFQVQWEEVDTSKLATVGDILVVNGTATVLGDTTMPVTCSVRVSDPVRGEATNVGPMAETLSQDVPAGMQSDNLNSVLDENRAPGESTDGRWTNWNNRNVSDNATLTMTWATAQSISDIDIYYRYDNSCKKPANVEISYSRNGVDFQNIGYTESTMNETGSAGNFRYVLAETINPVAVKIKFTQQDGTSGKCVGIYEIEFLSYKETMELKSSADLSGITVNGEAVAGFDAATLIYGTADPGTAAVTAESADNAGITVLPVYNGEIKILTVSEDGSDAKTYILKAQADELAAVKEAGIQALQAYRATKKDTNYAADGIAELDKALEDGIAAIEAAESTADVTAASDRAKAAMDEVETLAVLDDLSANDLDTDLPDTAAFVEGESAGNRAVQGWYTVDDTENVINAAMTGGKPFTVSARVYVPADAVSTTTGTWENSDKFNMIASLGDKCVAIRLDTQKSGNVYVQALVFNGGWITLDSRNVGADFAEKWHTIVVTFSNNTLELIVDGESHGTKPVPNTIQDQHYQFTVGQDPFKPERTTVLTFDQIVVFNEALTAEALEQVHMPEDENVVLFMDYDEPTAIELDQTEATLMMDNTLTLTPTVTPADAADRVLEWSVEDDTVATVENGVVTPVRYGETVITVKIKGTELTASCKVTVIDPVNEAINELTAYRETLQDVDYFDEELEQLNQAYEDGKTAIQAAEGEQAIAQALADAKAALDAVQTRIEIAEQIMKEAQQAKTEAETAKKAAEEAKKQAEEAKAAWDKAKAEAEEKQLAAEQAKDDAEAAEAAAKAAKDAADAALALSEAEKKAAEEAQTAAQAAEAAAKAAQEAAEADQLKAEEAQAAAEAAKEAAQAAQAALAAQKQAAEEAQAAAEAAQKAAEAAEAAAQAEKKAAEEALKAAEEERKAAEEAKAAAEAAKKEAEEAALKGGKYQTSLAVQNMAAQLDKSSYDAAQIKELEQLVADSLKQIEAAETLEEVEAILEETEAAMQAIADVCPSNAYTDVAKDAWYHEYVDYMVEKGYMNGVSDTRFDVDGSVTRAQLVTILYRVAGEPSVAGLDNPFKDVEQDQWYTDAIVWAASEGVVNGVSKNEFAPGKKITREQIVTILYRYDGEQKQETDHLADFTDAGKIADYAVDAMNWAVGQGVMNGVNATTLAPADTATRAQICAIVMRYLEK